MDYSLALELKNAGFPQNKDGDGTFLCECSHLSKDPEAKTVLGDTHERAYVPTLEELIEACGDGFNSLIRQDDWYGSIEWIASSGGGGSLSEIGSTPLEAVLRLWLALNKK